MKMNTISTTIKFGLAVGIIILAGTFITKNRSHKPLQEVPVVKEGLRGKIAGRFQQEFDMTRDPKTNTVPTERLMAARAIAEEKRALKAASAFPVYWEERGPDNIGGRTRGLIFDASDNTQKTVWAAGVAGGIWKTTNIDASPPGWTKVDDLFENLAITTIAQDPTNSNTLYFGTGEGFGNQDAVAGLGIWKSVDGGVTWEVLSSTFGNNSFRLVNKIVIDATGQLYVATNGGGVQFSNDNGVSFSQVLGNGLFANTNNANDLEIATNGDIYAGMRADGIYKLTNGMGSWTALTNNLPTSNFGRVELTTAPGTPQTVYVAFADTTTLNNGGCLGIFRSTNGGNTWAARTVPGNIGTQCWYDLIMAVDPNDASRVWVGGVRLFVSADGGNNWTQANVDHSDQHAIVYRPGDSDEMLLGNDGGVERTLAGSVGTPTFSPRNDGYNVTQFYAMDVHPTSGSNEMIGGTQDNATPVYSSAGLGSTSCVLCCCDGGWAHIDQDDPSIVIASTQNGSFNLSTGGTGGAFNNIVPGNNARRFITPSTYDSDNDILYVSDVQGTYIRVTDIGGANTLTVQAVPGFGTSLVSALAVSPNTANRVFMGLGNGDVFQIDNADVDGGITATNLNTPINAFLSSIVVENGDDQHIVITYSTYGVVSIWETTNGGTNWRNVEGNLPDMPVRWVLFHPFDPEQAIIATELGVWTTSDLTELNPDWQPTNGYGLANVRVDMLVYRPSDNLMAAATHGRGVFSTDYFGMLADCQPNLNLSGIITPGIYVVSEILTTDGTVEGATAVILQAGEMVVLEPDFTAEIGSDFWALILPCDLNGSFTNEDDQYYLKLPDESGTLIDDIEAKEPLTKETEKLKCYPNPTQGIATVEYNLNEDKTLRVVVMNARGQLKDVLADGYFDAGLQRFQWDTNGLESGLYFIQAQMESHSVTEKIFVVK